MGRDKLINEEYEFYGHMQIKSRFDKEIRKRLNLSDSDIIVYKNNTNQKQNECMENIVNEWYGGRIIIVDEVHSLRGGSNTLNDDTMPIHVLQYVMSKASKY